MANPFKPTAGATPPLLVGRNRVIEEFLESLDDGPGAPGLLELITGAAWSIITRLREPLRKRVVYTLPKTCTRFLKQTV